MLQKNRFSIKIYENQTLKILLKIPFAIKILLFIEKLTVFLKKNSKLIFLFYIKLVRFFLSCGGMNNKNNIKKDFNFIIKVLKLV